MQRLIMGWKFKKTNEEWEKTEVIEKLHQNRIVREKKTEKL